MRNDEIGAQVDRLLNDLASVANIVVTTPLTGQAGFARLDRIHRLRKGRARNIRQDQVDRLLYLVMGAWIAEVLQVVFLPSVFPSANASSGAAPSAASAVAMKSSSSPYLTNSVPGPAGRVRLSDRSVISVVFCRQKTIPTLIPI